MSSAFRWSIDADFMQFLDGVVGGTGVEEFTDTTLAGEQFALF